MGLVISLHCWIPFSLQTPYFFQAKLSVRQLPQTIPILKSMGVCGSRNFLRSLRPRTALRNLSFSMSSSSNQIFFIPRTFYRAYVLTFAIIHFYGHCPEETFYVPDSSSPAIGDCSMSRVVITKAHFRSSFFNITQRLQNFAKIYAS